MTMNSDLQPDRKTVTEINTQFSNGVLRVDNSYQRRNVWNRKNKIRLIETILMGFPMPEIYFWQNSINSKTGEIEYSIVDGQQRIRAIKDYISDEFPLVKSSLDTKNKTEAYAGKKFSQLDNNFRKEIWSYQLNVRVFPHTVTRDEIVSVFLRLNETDKALNPQELRHAQFNGLFIQTAEQIAELDFWSKWKIFTPARIRRMSDILAVSQFLAFLRHGIEGDVSPKAINALYDQFNESYKQRKDDIQACEVTLDFIDGLFSKSAAIHKFFKVQTHFYPFFIASYIYLNFELTQKQSVLTNRLEKFIELYADKTKRSEVLSAYRLASNEGMLKKANREIRVNCILSVLQGKFK